MKTQEELEAMSEAEYLEWCRPVPLPKNLAGFQHITNGVVKRGDLLVKNGDIASWAEFSVGKDVGFPDLVSYGYSIYRRMPVDSHESIYQKSVEVASPVYRPLEPDEIIQEGDEYCYDKKWCPFIESVGETYKPDVTLLGETRTTRTKPSKPSGRREDGPLVNTKPLDPKGDAGKLKPQLQLIPPALNQETAKALALGADKYGPWNWRDNKVEIMTYIGAMKRHLDCILEGEDIDPESGAHHLGHVAASCGIVLDAQKRGTLVDNRPNASAHPRP
jgi:hypothetical protein